MKKVLFQNLNIFYKLVVRSNDIEQLKYLVQNEEMDINRNLYDEIDTNILKTPLHYAITLNYIEMAKVCIDELGADINLGGPDYLPIDLAWNYCHIDLVKILISKKSLKSDFYEQKIKENDIQLLFFAAKKRNIKEVKKYIIYNNIKNLLNYSSFQPLLDIAAENDDIYLAKLLVDDYHMKIVNEFNFSSCIEIASKNYSYSVLSFFLEKHPYSEKRLIFNPKQHLANEMACLYKAIKENDSDKVLKLLKENEYISEHFRKSNFRKFTPLHYAVSFNRFEIVKNIVVLTGKKMNLEGENPPYPLFIALNKGFWKIIKYLIENNFQTGRISDYGLTVYSIKVEEITD